MNTMRRRFACIAIASGLYAGCSVDPEPRQPAVQIEAERLPWMPEGHPDTAQLSISSRGPRRLSIEQLERSIEQVGALDQGSVQLPESLALALGEPDYLRITEESLEPSPLFMKFMMDLAGFVCGSFINYDPERPAADRIFGRYEQVDDNIRHALFRFTAIEGEAAEPYVVRLRQAYDSALGPAGARGGWEAVCISLFTAPEFLLY